MEKVDINLVEFFKKNCDPYCRLLQPLSHYYQGPTYAKKEAENCEVWRRIYIGGMGTVSLFYINC